MGCHSRGLCDKFAITKRGGLLGPVWMATASPAGGRQELKFPPTNAGSGLRGAPERLAEAVLQKTDDVNQGPCCRRIIPATLGTESLLR